MPPAANIGTSFISFMALYTSGMSTIDDTSPQCPPASPPATIKISTPALIWLIACFFAPTNAPTLTPASFAISTICFGGMPSAFTIILIGWLKATVNDS